MAYFEKLRLEKWSMKWSEDGNLVKTKDCLPRWREFFESKLNYNRPFNILDATGTYLEPCDCNCKSPTEIISEIRKVNPLGDGLRAELLKCCVLHKTSRKTTFIGMRKAYDWNKLNLLPVPRKNDRTHYESSRNQIVKYFRENFCSFAE